MPERYTYEGQGMTDQAYVAVSAAFLALDALLILFIVAITAYRYRNNSAVANGDLCPLRSKLLFVVMPIPLVIYAIIIALPILFLVIKDTPGNHEFIALGVCAIGVILIGFFVISCEIAANFKRGQLPEERVVMWKNEKKVMDRHLKKMRGKLGDRNFGCHADAGESGSVITGDATQKKTRIPKASFVSPASLVNSAASTRKIVARMIFEEVYSAAYLLVVLPFFIVLIYRHS